MITLKKSFELQNYLQKLYCEVLDILMIHKNITICKQEHMRTKVYEEAEDEVKIVPKEIELNCTVNNLIDFACELQKEKELLTFAINEAKKEIDFDGMISINNQKRNLLKTFLHMVEVKPSERMTYGHSVKFNSEGNQVEYCYDIREVTNIDFNRNKLKNIIGRLRKEIDETSTSIDKMMIETTVDFESRFEIGSTLEDSIESLIK